ncbi:MAG: site-specific integrase [Lachnospiraceae bacterium]|nr:site-specific integrase [Lachnospiraceae bacterium]
MNSNLDFLVLIKKARDHMEENNYSYTSVTCYMRTWRSVYNFGLSKGITHYSAELAEQYMVEKYHMPIGKNEVEHKALSPYMQQKIRALRALTDFTLHGYIPKITRGEQVNWPKEYEKISTEYLSYHKSLGYANQTHRKRELDIFRFICFLHTKEVIPENIEAANIYDYFKTLCHFSKPTLVSIRCSLVHYLKYLHKNGITDKDMSEYIPRIHYYAKAKIDKVWSDEEIEQMLNSIDRANPVGKRDYAIMAIAANLGLRTSDIVSLTIKNFNWNLGTISIIQQKTKEQLSLPITEQIGKAVIDYWMNGRPKTSADKLFVEHTLPYQGLNKSMLYYLFNKYYEKSGLNVPETRQHGLHSLRHSLASRLLEKDTPVNVISNILGHVNSNSAKAYLQVDIESLRRCSLEVPDYE